MGALASTVSKAFGPSVVSGRPTKTAMNIVMFGDNLRGWFVDAVPMLVSVSVLYDYAFIEGRPERTWGPLDVMMVWLLAWFVRRTALVRRWS